MATTYNPFDEDPSSLAGIYADRALNPYRRRMLMSNQGFDNTQFLPIGTRNPLDLSTPSDIGALSSAAVPFAASAPADGGVRFDVADLGKKLEAFRAGKAAENQAVARGTGADIAPISAASAPAVEPARVLNDKSQRDGVSLGNQFSMLGDAIAGTPGRTSKLMEENKRMAALRDPSSRSAGVLRSALATFGSVRPEILEGMNEEELARAFPFISQAAMAIDRDEKMKLDSENDKVKAEAARIRASYRKPMAPDAGMLQADRDLVNQDTKDFNAASGTAQQLEHMIATGQGLSDYDRARHYMTQLKAVNSSFSDSSDALSQSEVDRLAPYLAFVDVKRMLQGGGLSYNFPAFEKEVMSIVKQKKDRAAQVEGEVRRIYDRNRVKWEGWTSGGSDYRLPSSNVPSSPSASAAPAPSQPDVYHNGKKIPVPSNSGKYYLKSDGTWGTLDSEDDVKKATAAGATIRIVK